MDLSPLIFFQERKKDNHTVVAHYVSAIDLEVPSLLYIALIVMQYILDLISTDLHFNKNKKAWAVFLLSLWLIAFLISSFHIFVDATVLLLVK